jgi:hypothetical protein
MSEEAKYSIPKKQVSDLIAETSADFLINDALGIIATEITKFRGKVNRGLTLTLPEARILQGYIKSLIDLSKEKRDQISDIDISKLSNEEIAQLLSKLMSAKK